MGSAKDGERFEIVEERRWWERLGERERWCWEAEREARRRIRSRTAAGLPSVASTALRDWPRLRRVGMSVEIAPFFVGRGTLGRGGERIVGVVDWEFSPLEWW